MSLQDRVQHVLDTHHALLHRELPRLDQALGSAPAPLRRAWSALSPLLRDHLHKEEVLLFPAILAVARGEAAAGCGILGPIRQMEHEHGQIRALEAELRGLLPQAGVEQQALETLLDDLTVHAATEDDQVFPMALAALAALLEPELARVGRLQADKLQDEALAEVCAVALEDHARLRQALAAVEAEPALTHQPAIAIMATELHRHIDLEERRLYPALFALARGRLKAPMTPEAGDAWLSILHELPLEEAAAADWLRAVRGAVAERPPQLDALLAAIATHAALEVHQVFPLAMQALAALPPLDEGEARPAPVAPAPFQGRVLRQTRGRCSVCLQDVPAELLRTDDEVRLVKRCVEHGETSELLSRAPEYWADVDRFYFQVNGEEWPQRDFMIRMTEKCNLDCPICLAKANTEETPDLDLSGLQALLSERRGMKIDLLAAEPTLREDLPDWIRKVKASGNIAALHTNGIKLADAAYARTLADAGVDEVFLQFDGFDDDAHMQLRGARLLRRRLQALANLRELGIATSLIVVVAKGLNEDQVGRVYRFALQPENSHVREVFFLGLRVLGSTRYAQAQAADGQSMADRALMPDALIDVLCEQEPSMNREDIRRFNKLYFSMLSAFKVRKCLYVQHYLVARDGHGGATTAAGFLPLERIEQACESYARRLDRHPHLARGRFLAELARLGVRRETMGMLFDMAQLQTLFKTGMKLEQVPRRFLLLGFITACDPQNFDAQVAINCGKGELSVDGGFVASGAVANVEREARFDETERKPGQARKRRES